MEACTDYRVVDDWRGVATALAHHVWVPLVLLRNVRETVANAHALELDLDVPMCEFLVALEDAMRHGWDEVPRVALASDEELFVVLRHSLEQRLKELIHVLGDAIFVVVPRALGEA